MSKAWLKELYLVALLVAGLGLVFGFFGLWAWGMIAGLVLYLLHTWRQLHRFAHWLQVGRLRNPPESWGVWGHLFAQYDRWQKRYYSRKKRLGKVIREFRDSTSAMPDGTLVLDADLCILWFNEAAESMLRLSSQRDIGQPILNLVRSPVFRDYVQAQQYDHPVELTSPQDDNVLLSARLIPYGRAQYLLLFRDVTRIQRLQSMRRDFVANASHELRSPLTVISGYLQALPEAEGLPREWQQPIREMQRQTERMSGLVEDLLELSRLETETSDASSEQAVDMDELINRVIQSTRQADEGDHPIEFLPKASNPLLGVERELHSAFSNLIANALRYSPSAAPVVVSWSRDEQGRGIFEVEDQGVGIDAKHLPFITQRFYRVDSARGEGKSGTGLGLAIVKHVLQRHGARLEIDSVLGEGSVFRCIFPPGRIAESRRPAPPSTDSHETETTNLLNQAVKK